MAESIRKLAAPTVYPETKEYWDGAAQAGSW